MKKFLLFLIVLVVVLSSCINVEETNETQKDVLNTDNLELSYIPHIYNGCWCLGDAFNSTHADKDIEKLVLGSETTIEDVDESIEITLLGKTYTLTYEETTWSNRNQQKKHRYIRSDNKGTIYIDAETARITDIYGFAYDEALKTESDYINTIKSIVGETYDLSEYELTCSTVLSDDGSKVETYNFNYIKRINGIEIRDSVKAEFKVEEKKLWIELTDRRSADGYYYPLLECIDNFDGVIVDYMNSQLKDGVTVLEYSVEDTIFEVIGGKTYLLTVVSIKHRKSTQISDSAEISSCVADLIVEVQYTE